MYKKSGLSEISQISGRRIKIADDTDIPDSTTACTMAYTKKTTDKMFFSSTTVSNTMADTHIHDTDKTNSDPSSIHFRNTCVDICSVNSTTFTNKK